MGINNTGKALSTLPLRQGGSFSGCFLRVWVGVAGGGREKSSGDPKEALVRGTKPTASPHVGPIPPPAQAVNEPASGLFVLAVFAQCQWQSPGDDR